MPDGFEATFSSVNIPEGTRQQPNATITYGPVNLQDSAGMYTRDPDPTAIFVDTIISQRYEQDRHVYMMPIASPTGFQNQSAAFVQLAAPTTLRVVDGTIARLNTPPTVPSPQSLDANWILLDAHAEAPVLSVALDGKTPLYRISFCYVYGKTNPNDNVYDDLIFPRPPWLKDNFPNGREMPTGNQDATLTDISPFTGTGTIGGSVGADGSVGTGGGGFSTGGSIGGSAGAGGSFG